MEQSNDKSFSGSKPRIMPVDYSKSSLSDRTSVLPENHPEAPSYKLVTNSRNPQVPYSASYEKDTREHDASLSGSASFVTSSPSLVIRPPDVVTTISASNKGPLKDVNFRTDAADPDLHGNNPSYVNELHPLLSSEGKVRFDASQLRIHLDRNDPVSVESFSAKNKELSMDKSISEDALDQIFKAKSGVQISHTSSDGFNLPLEFTQAVNSVENTSESLDHYNPAVDSPCWKGAPIGCFSPFEASKAVSSQYLKTLESCNNSDFQLPQFFPFNIDDAVKLSSQNPIEKTVYHEIGSLENSLAASPKRPSVANLTFSKCRSDDAAKAGSFYSKESFGYEVQHSAKAFEPGKDDASPSQSTETCVVDAGSNRNNPSRSGTSNVPFHGTEDALSSLASVEDASAKLTKLHKADSTSKIDVQMLVNKIYNLSETLLFHSSNDSIELKEGDHEALKNVILNLHQCLLKGTEQKLPTPESLFPEQGTSQYLEELPKLHKEVSGDRPRLAKEAAIIAQDQLDHQCVHEEKHHHIVSVNKNEKVSDSVCVKGDANMVKEDNMTQAIMKVLNDNFKYEEDMQPKSLLYKNLWLEAEAELCSVNYKARYNRMKIEMEKSELDKTKDVSENTMNVEKELRSKVSHEMNTVDKLAPEARGGLSPVISIQDTTSIPDVMCRYSILKDRIDHSNSATDVEGPSSSKVYPDLNKVDQLASETAEEKSLTQDISIQNSPIIDTTCHADSVMARFHILKCRVENSNSVTSTVVEEPSSIDVIPDLINVDKLVHEATEVKGSPIPDVSTQNSPVSTLSCHTEDVESSVMARFHVLKHRIDNVNSMDVRRQEFPEVFHFGFAGESKHRPIIRDKSEDGSVDVTLAPVLQHHSANSSEGSLTVKEFYLCKDDPVIQPCQSNRLGDPLPAGWFDTTSDWEHVMKEDFEE
ncbi:hypothetical protein CMV_025910 [Castanea mollissima]|uniref:Uncharacterized protein n=1 Tax=Castanea mollissima TaxID=60419 RepID=A0A8J4VAY3_9ROSI|nr:hypothetical protein CMV_025910 [Castanea mollissima]